MESYFNEICAVYFLQTNGEDGFPTITELACLYFNIEDELLAIAYLLGKNKGGADCLIEDETVYK